MKPTPRPWAASATRRRRTAASLFFTLLTAQLIDASVALATPAYLARPGAGVSRTPLRVLAFDRPDFGTLQDAVNLANGNAYVEGGGLARNNTLSAGDDTTTVFGKTTLATRERLDGFTPTGTLPTTLAVSQGDGSLVTFTQLSSPTWASLPTWIARYQSVTSAKIYASTATPGTQVPVEYLVTLPKPGAPTSNLAHHYDHDGNRTTFVNNGPYASYSQDPYQQYRGALASDPEGLTTALKTTFTYTGSGNGLLSRIKDEYGRETDNTWNADNTLAATYLLVTNSASPSTSWTRKIEFSYATVGTERVLTGVNYTGSDGKGSTVTRAFGLDYTTNAGQTVLQAVRRPTLSDGSAGTPAGLGWRTTTYAYDTSNRVTTVSETGQPDTTFTYDTSPTYGGARVTVTQSGKSRKYDFNTYKQLRQVSVYVNNPATVDTDTEVTTYAYYPDSTTAAVTAPSGATTHFDYDPAGNLIRETVYATAVANPAAGDPGSSPVAHTTPTGFTRNRTASFDRDNRLASSTTPAASGSAGSASYSYQAQSDVITNTATYSTTASSETFSVPQTRTTSVQVNGVEKYNVADTVDTSGRLTSEVRSGASQTRTTSYTYATGTNGTTYLPTTSGDSGTAVAAIQYGDLVASVTDAGVTSNFVYDPLGNLARVSTPGAYVSSWSSGTTPTASSTDRETRASFNAFGQQVWAYTASNVGGTLTPVSKGVSNYYASGELNDRWKGAPSNVTDVQYVTNSASADFGRRASIVMGAGSAGSVTTTHGTQNFTYDPFGRIKTLVKDGFTTSYQYDTLDRQVEAVRPDGSVQDCGFDNTGSINQDLLTDTDGTTYEWDMTQDALGRTTAMTPLKDGSADPARGTRSAAYDPYDRPIKVTDNALTMNAAGDDRTTFMKYDEFGDLTAELGPALKTVTGSSYSDARRPFTSYSYDALLRLTAQSVLADGATPATPASMTMPSGGTAATTTFNYDSFDHLTGLTDPTGYTRSYTYDKSDQLTSETDQVWKTTEAGYSTLNNGFTSITARAAFDAAGRPVQQMDARGNSSSTTWNTLGKPISFKDARGVVTSGYGYTPDFLLESVYQPDMDGGTSAASFDPASPTGFTRTSMLMYGSRVFPTGVRRANMDTAAGPSTGSLTSYTRDYLGRPTTTTFPDTTTTVESFDGRGNLLSLTDPYGFKETRTFDSANRLLVRLEKARTTGSGATIDSASGLSGGLRTEFTYDPAGNALTRSQDGMNTEYESNSVGEVVSSTRPHMASSSSNRQYFTYRPDGARSAETTYGYAGDLLSSKVATSSSSNLPTATSGNVVVFDRDVVGHPTVEVSRGYWNGTASNWSSTINTTYNGLGQRAKRAFQGSSSIFANMRTLNGTDSGSANSMSVWKYDPNGNLTSAYDALPDGSNVQNSYSYTYSASNQELTQNRDVELRMQNFSSGNALTGKGGSNGLLLGGTKGSGTTVYNERDLPVTSTVVDQAPARSTTSGQQFSSFGTATTTTTALTYFQDGHRHQTNMGGVLAARTDALDGLGRVTQQYDASSPYGAVTINSSYGSDGTVTREAMSGSTSAFKEIVKHTLGNRQASRWTSAFTGAANVTTYSASGVDFEGVPTAVTGQNAVTYTFDPYGNIATDVRGGVTSTYAYDSNNHQTGVSNSGGSVSYVVDAQGRRLAATGGAFDGFSQRYDAQGRMAVMTQAASGGTHRMDLFAYDPYGHKAIASVGGDIENTASAFTVSRDNRAGVWLRDQPILLPRAQEVYSESSGTVTGSSGNATSRDSGYSFADGSTDNLTFGGVSSFSIKGTISELSAPVKALSDTLRVNPLDVTPPAVASPTQNPGQVSAPKVGIQSVGITGVSTLAAPVSVLPNALQGLNPLDVKAGTAQPASSVGSSSTAVRASDIVITPTDGSQTPTTISGTVINGDAYTTELMADATVVDSVMNDSIIDGSQSIVATYGGSEGVAATLPTTYATEANQSVLSNVNGTFAERGLTYTPTTEAVTQVNQVATVAMRPMTPATPTNTFINGTVTTIVLSPANTFTASPPSVEPPDPEPKYDPDKPACVSLYQCQKDAGLQTVRTPSVTVPNPQVSPYDDSYIPPADLPGDVRAYLGLPRLPISGPTFAVNTPSGEGGGEENISEAPAQIPGGEAESGGVPEENTSAAVIVISDAEYVTAIRQLDIGYKGVYQGPALPSNYPLTPIQKAALSKNVQDVINRTLPAVQNSSSASITEQSLLNQISKPRFRFLNQTPEAKTALENALKPYPNVLRQLKVEEGE